MVSELVLQETERNLQAEAPRAVPLFRLLVGVLPLTVVNPGHVLIAQAAEVVDPKDAPIVAAAAESGAGWLATYDRRHLLAARRGGAAEARTRRGIGRLRRLVAACAASGVYGPVQSSTMLSQPSGPRSISSYMAGASVYGTRWEMR